MNYNTYDLHKRTLIFDICTHVHILFTFRAENKTNTNLKKNKALYIDNLIECERKMQVLFFLQFIEHLEFKVTSAKYLVCPTLEPITA